MMLFIGYGNLLYYLLSRYYNSEIGRFISEDRQTHVSDQQDLINSNLYAYCNNNPINFIDPDGNSAAELTKDLVYFLIDNTFTVSATQNGQFSDLFYFFGFYRDKKGVVYHARQDCLQQYFGYNDFYDTVFNYFTSMTKMISPFKYKGKDFKFWAWKGNYLNLGAGAELGIYSRLSSTDLWLTETEYAMPMILTLNYKGKPIIFYEPKTDDPDDEQKSKWWLTGFNPFCPNKIADDLTATYTIDFSGNKDMFTAFCNSVQSNKWELDSAEYTATLTF